MNASYAEIDGKPAVVQHESVGLGIAIDMSKAGRHRQLLVPSIKEAQDMDFAAFRHAYEDLIHRARNNKLGVDDFAGTTASLTNPGTIGTVHSVPRLMPGQGVIPRASGPWSIRRSSRARPWTPSSGRASARL